MLAIPETTRRRNDESTPRMQKLTQETARALADAGFMPVGKYVQLCRKNGWQGSEKPAGADAIHN